MKNQLLRRRGSGSEIALAQPIPPFNSNALQATRWKMALGPNGTIPGSGSAAQRCPVPGWSITASYITAGTDIALVYFEDPATVAGATGVPLTNGGVIYCPEGFSQFWIRAMFTSALTQAIVTVGQHPEAIIQPGAPTDVLVRSGLVVVSGSVTATQTPTVTDHGEVAVPSATRTLIATIAAATGSARIVVEVTKETNASTTPNPFADPGEYIELVSLVSAVEHTARSGVANGVMPALPAGADSLYRFIIDGPASASGYRVYANQNSGSTRDYHAQSMVLEIG